MLKDFCKENPTRRYVQDQENKIQTANDWLNRMAPYEPSNDFLLHGIKSERAHPRCTACLSPVLYHAPLSPPHSQAGHIGLDQSSAVGQAWRAGRRAGICTKNTVVFPFPSPRVSLSLRNPPELWLQSEDRVLISGC